MLASFLAVMAVAAVVGLVWRGHLAYSLIVALPFALLAAMWLLAKRAETAAYRSIEGQPGASIAALRSITKGWEFGEEPVAVDPRTQDLVFRGLGRPGVVLVSEGPPRVTRLLESERKKIARVLPNVPIHVIQSGDADGQVPLKKLPNTVRKLKKTLTTREVAEVSKRIKALGGMRVPLPKGVDPMRARPDRKGLKGR